jgi:hypothetical protein
MPFLLSYATFRRMKLPSALEKSVRTTKASFRLRIIDRLAVMMSHKTIPKTYNTSRGTATPRATNP